MCGICGYTKFNHSSEKNIDFMLEEIKHRGPDFFSKKIEKTISLGHSRLSIIDLSQEANQPFISSDGRYSIVYNGEIYNYKNIRDKLEKDFKTKFRTSSDTEVILNGYIHLKNKIFKELDGMFALAIWDNQLKKIILARDIFGEKPLFYFIFNNDIFFSSEIKSLSMAPMFNNKISNIALKSFLANNFVESNVNTIFENIKKVEPGTFIEFDQNNFKKSKYFCYQDISKNNENRNDTNHLDTILSESVKSRMISDTEGGIFLSGGLDSSLIAHYASKNQNDLKCFTLGFKEKSYDETEKAKYVAKKLKLKHYIHYFDTSDIKEIPKAIMSTNELFADTAIISTYFLSKFSRQYVKFCLGGDGADEIFSGYETYDATMIYKFLKNNSFLKTITNFASKFDKIIPQTKSKVNTLFKIKKFLEVFKLDYENPHQKWRQINSQNNLYEILNREFYNENQNENYIFKKNQKEKFINNLNNLNISDLENFLAEDILVKTDRSSMAHGLELRSPYLNSKLLNYVFNIKEKERYRLFNKKIMLKKILVQKFDKNFINQKKRGFNSPVSIWLKNELSSKFTEIIESDKSGIFNKKAIYKLHKNHNISGNDFGNRLFNIMCLVMWLNLNKVKYD